MGITERTCELLASDGATLNYRVWSPAVSTRVPVVVFHGVGIHSGRYSELARALASRGHPVFALDLRGHGLSQGRRGELGGVSLLTKDLDAFLNAVTSSSGDSGVIIVGESMGALIALSMVPRLATSVRAGVFIAPGLLPAREQVFSLPAAQDLLATSLRRKSLAIGLLGWRLEVTTRAKAHIRYTRRDPLTVPFVSWRYLLTLANLGFRWRYRYASRVQFPVLILQSPNDRIVSPRTHRLLANALRHSPVTVRTFDGSYHALLWDVERRQVIEAICEWLGGSLPS
jgi:alpha-beta hydrolase superfamily lysophospholipase